MFYDLIYFPKKCSTSVCVFTSPRGWKIDIPKEYTIDDGNHLATIMNLPFGREGEFRMRVVSFSFFYNKDANEKRFLKTKVGIFAQDVNAVRTVVSIRRKRCYILSLQWTIISRTRQK